MKNSQNGFTLVELMVVVAIIGLLSAVAIPNFQKYQARTKTAEAKLHLAAIYTAEASFFTDYTIYHTCLKYMGYDPREESNTRYFTTGFTHAAAAIDGTAYTSAINAGINTTDCSAAATNTVNTAHFVAGKYIGSKFADSTHITTSTNGSQSDTSTMTFLAGAAGIIHKEFTSTAQSAYFTINQVKKISVARNGF